MLRPVEALQVRLVFAGEIDIQLPDTFGSDTFMYARKQDDNGWVGVNSMQGFQAYPEHQGQDGMFLYTLALPVFVRHTRLPSQWRLAANELVYINPSSALGDK